SKWLFLVTAVAEAHIGHTHAVAFRFGLPRPSSTEKKERKEIHGADPGVFPRGFSGFHFLLFSISFRSQSAMHYLMASSLVSSMRQEDAAGSSTMESLRLRVLAIVGAGISGILSFATIASADEAEHGLAAPSYPWPHKGILSSYDHAS
ncbi:hypothetical protein B296_00039748, partial [Ensete ventricosum]